LKRMLIERGAMGQKKEVKLEDIADSLGVSIVTVSNALKGKKGVSEGLRNRIKEAAQRMGYKTPVYEEKEKARSHIIGVLVAERYVKEFPSFYMEIYRRVAQETAKRGHVTVLEVVTCEKENLSADAMVFLEQSMDGLIVIGELYQEYMKMLRKVSRIPIVCVDYYDVYDDMDYIITDGFGGMEQMTRLLLKEGYRDLIFVGSPNATKNITDRYFGYCKAMQRAGMEEEQFRFVADRECGKGNYRKNCHRDLSAIAIKRQCCCLKD
jgi:DNA-binding LacI/PurR family transcriptional regulator